MKESFIVTGGSGFIGSTLCEYLCQKYPETRIINVSKLTYATLPRMTEYLENFANYKLIPIDITDMQLYKLIQEYKVSRIYHLAAETHVDRSFVYPHDFLVSNVEGTFNILEAVRASKKDVKIYYMSTDEVFGSVKTGWRNEKSMCKPENPYAATKVSCEALCRAWTSSFKMPIVVGRSMNVFGPRQHPEKLIPKIITNIISGKEYQLYKGNSLRGWNYVYDTADAIDTIMIKGESGQIYHVPPTTMKGVEDINECILKLLPSGRKFFKGYIGERLKDDDRYALSGTKMQYELHWMPKWGWEGGMEATVEWYANNKGLWT